MPRPPSLRASLALLALAACEPGPPTPAPDVIYVGRFVTLDPARPEVEALAVSAGRIVAVGDRPQIEGLAGTGTETVEFGGVAVPGFADAHAHVSGVGATLERMNLQGMTKEEVLATLAERVGATPAGEWISGRGWDEGFFEPPVFPTAADLDAVTPDNPVVLTRIDGHSSWVNSRVLRLSGITSATEDPPGGRVVRDAAGEPTGLLVDAAQALVDQPPTDEDAPETLERRVRNALQQYARWGVTSVHDAGAGLDEIELYRRLMDAGELPVRVYAMPRGRAAVEHYLARGPEIGLGDGMLTVRGFKVLLDGALGSRGAQLTEPYTDAPGETGLEQMSDADLEGLVRASRETGFQVNAHAIGDRAVERALDVFERGGVTPADRFRIEHASIIRPEDVPRFVRLGVVASMQPVFVGEYGRWAEDRVGPERVRWVMPIRDLLAAGAVVASGTDYPASDSGDPRATLAGLVARQSAGGEPPGGWYPDQAVDAEAALRSMSIGAAFAAFQDDELGALTVGRYADFTVLSADPRAVAPEALLALSVRMTVVGGRITFDGRAGAGD